MAAISVGIVKGETLLDLCYEEDSQAEVDANVVMTAQGDFVEVQSTAEGKPFSFETLTVLLSLARDGITDLLAAQEQCLHVDHHVGDACVMQASGNAALAGIQHVLSVTSS